MSDKRSVIIDPNLWSFEDYLKFAMALSKNDFQTAMKYIMKAAIGWSYDVKFEPEAYRKLPMSELPKITYTVRDLLEGVLGDLDVSDVSVDLDQWTMDEYFKFQAASKSADIRGFERMMRRVCELEGVTEDRLTFVQGSKMTRAIADQTKKLFSAGN